MNFTPGTGGSFSSAPIGGGGASSGGGGSANSGPTGASSSSSSMRPIMNRFSQRFNPEKRIRRRITRSPYRMSVTRPSKLRLTGAGGTSPGSRGSTRSNPGRNIL